MNCPSRPLGGKAGSAYLRLGHLLKCTTGTRKDSYCQVSWVASDGVMLEILGPILLNFL